MSIASKFSGPHMYPERLETGCVQLFEETYPTHSKEQKMALEILHLTPLIMRCARLSAVESVAFELMKTLASLEVRNEISTRTWCRELVSPRHTLYSYLVIDVEADWEVLGGLPKST